MSNNLNQVYMAGLKASPMIGIELILKAGMYNNKKVKAALMAGNTLAGLIFFG